MSGTLIGTHLCEPGTTRVGPLSSVMSSSITMEFTTRQSVGVHARHVAVQGLLALALERIAGIERIDADFAQEISAPPPGSARRPGSGRRPATC